MSQRLRQRSEISRDTKAKRPGNPGRVRLFLICNTPEEDVTKRVESEVFLTFFTEEGGDNGGWGGRG